MPAYSSSKGANGYLGETRVRLQENPLNFLFYYLIIYLNLFILFNYINILIHMFN